MLQAQEQQPQDGPISVKHESVYKLDELKIEPYDLRNLPPPPEFSSTIFCLQDSRIQCY